MYSHTKLLAVVLALAHINISVHAVAVDRRQLDSGGFGDLSSILGGSSTGSTGGLGDISSIMDGGSSTDTTGGLGDFSSPLGGSSTGSTGSLGDLSSIFGGSTAGTTGTGGFDTSSLLGGLGGTGSATGASVVAAPSAVASTDASGTSPATTASSSTDLGGCAPLYHYHAAGTSESGLGTVGNSFATSLPKNVPGAQVIAVNYNTDAEYSTTVAAGATTAANDIATMAAKCPNSKFSVSGYSKGAMVVHGIKLSTDVQAKVIGAAVFGDPDIREGTSGVPINNKSCFFSYCNTGDPVCQNGGDVTAHLQYVTNGSVDKASAGIAKCFSS